MRNIRRARNLRNIREKRMKEPENNDEEIIDTLEKRKEAVAKRRKELMEERSRK